jgi:hypothetical protein
MSKHVELEVPAPTIITQTATGFAVHVTLADANIAALDSGALDGVTVVVHWGTHQSEQQPIARDLTFEIPQLIDANDMVSDHSDDLSVMTYVSYFRSGKEIARSAQVSYARPAITNAKGPARAQLPRP